MNNLTIDFDKAAVAEWSKQIGAKLFQSNVKKIGDYAFSPFCIILKNEAGELLGGIKGEIFEAVCIANLVFVDEPYQQQGLGAKLMVELEKLAKSRGCEFIQLDTAEFQARGFYEKLGFQIVATLPRNFKGYATYILRKVL